MKQFLFSAVFLFFYLIGFGQCPTDSGIYFSTQEELNSFIVEYPNCTTLGNLIISGFDITDLSPLINITAISGIQIQECANLESLDGLDSLTSISGLDLIFFANPVLSDMSALQNVEDIHVRYFSISAMTVLENLDGFQNASIFIEDDFTINENNSLEHIDGLSGLTQIDFGGIGFVDNPNLNSIQGLSNTLISGPHYIEFIGNDVLQSLDGLNFENVHTFNLRLRNNALLSDITALSGIYQIITDLEIYNNDSLTNLNGLNDLVNEDFEAIRLDIFGNNVLSDISALNNIHPNALVYANIRENPILSVCESPTICTHLQSDFDPIFTVVENNASGCNSILEVQSICFPCENQIVLHSQEEVDALSVNYADCTDAPFGIVISGSDIVDLTPLQIFTSVNGNLTIQNNTMLETLEGLNNIESITDGSLIISNNPSLLTLNGLDELSIITGEPNGIEGGVIINDNPAMLSLDGLQHLFQVNQITIYENLSLQSLLGLNGLTEVVGGFGISGCPQLEVIDNLDNLLSVFDLAISNMQGLVTLQGFSNVSYKELYVDGNLSLISLVGLEGSTEIPGFMFIENNPVLSSLQGLENIEVVFDVSIFNNDALLNLEGFSPTVLHSIYIANNDNLQSLLGLESVIGGGEFGVTVDLGYNNSLDNISQLENLDANNIGFLGIYGNTSLETCNNLTVCNYLNSGNSASIMNNAPGCNSSSEIIEACNANFNRLKGSITYDIDENGCDDTDYMVENILITTTDGSETFSSISDEDGAFELFVGEGEYMSSVIIESLPVGFDVSPSSISTEFTGLGNTEIIDFCVVVDQEIVDVSVSLIPLQEPRPGIPADYIVQYENLGTQVTEGDITFVFDENIMFYVDSEEVPSVVDTNNITWTYSNLVPFESKSFIVSFELFIPPAVEGGESLNSVIQITTQSNDVDTSNNELALKETVVNSFDPNDKQVLQGSEILEAQVGEFLDYLVRFQNTGTADALKVVITDVLSENLDWNTLRILDASHDYRVEITNGNEVAFIFEDIYLPPEEMDPEGSNGYIAFEIRTLNTLGINDTVENTASIFFDFNEPIITSTVTTTVVKNLGVASFGKIDVRLYPNPVSQSLQIVIPQEIQFQKVIVLSLQGQKVSESKLPQVDMSALASGIYFVKIKTSQGEVTKKIVKN